MMDPAKVAIGIATFSILSLAAVSAVREGREGGDRQPTVHEVRISAMQFQPAVLDVRPGDTVVWINDDFLPHTATSRDGGWDSGEIPPNGSWQRVVGAPLGEYFCTFHPMMTGRLGDAAGAEDR